MSVQNLPKPTPEVARRIEELLREELVEIGVQPATLQPHEIAAGMVCHLGPDGSLTYSWQATPLLYVRPEKETADGQTSVLWRMFTRDDQEK